MHLLALSKLIFSGEYARICHLILWLLLFNEEKFIYKRMEKEVNDLLQKQRSIINKTTNTLNDIIFALIMPLQYFIMKHATHVTCLHITFYMLYF